MTHKLLAAAALTLLCGSALAGQEVRFHGEPIQDAPSGLTVLGAKERGLVAVTSARHHYSLVLPYGEDWTFSVDEGALLKGSSGLLNVTLSEETADGSPERTLLGVKERLSEPGRVKGLEEVELTAFKKEPVLRTVVDARAATGADEFRGVKLFHVFGAKRSGKGAYLLHLSRVVPAAEAAAFDVKPLLSLVTTGFRVDFQQGDAKP
jgi:hypothetical protein